MKPDIHTLSDSLLWKRFLKGDSSAYTQIYNRTVQDLFRFGLLYTSDKELIKDCIHDVFVKIHMNRAKLAPTDNIAAYLTVALKNTLFNALKKTTDSLSFDEIGEREETVDESPSSPETIYINNEQEKQVQATVHTMMSVLTDRQREIIYYRYIKEGKFVMKGRIPTDKDNNWAIHASTFEHNGQRYMIWCGWQKRRIDSETQCIYIASMENPWTLSSDRVLISKPEYEWECQWVNPDGSKTAYPIHVNEAPHFFQPKNKDKVCIFYSASGSWTPYYCVGLLTADANANLLDPASWKKHPTPVFQQEPENEVFGPGGSSFVSSPDGKECYMLYHARQIPNDAPGAMDSRTPRLQKIEWDKDGMPVLGIPDKTGTILPKPSGTKIAEK